MNATQYTSLIHTVNFSSPSWDAFIFFFWIVVAIIYSFSSGRGRIISMLMSVYMAELIVIQAPFLSTALGAKLGTFIFLSRLITFLALFGFFFLVLSKFVFRTSVEGRGGLRSWIFSVMFGFLQVGFLVSVILSFLPNDVKSTFAPLTKVAFLSSTAQFIWLILPIIFLVLIGRYASDHNRLD